MFAQLRRAVAEADLASLEGAQAGSRQAIWRDGPVGHLSAKLGR